MNIDIEKVIQERLEDRQIRCPLCGELQSSDDGAYPVTYWGEGPEEVECQQCEKKFWVEEIVDRTYDIRKENDF
jgi:uncharacterized protein with PIN domain